MTQTAFNTSSEVQRLRDAGFELAQAEAITLSIHGCVTGGIATKTDLDLLRDGLETVEDGIKGQIGLVNIACDVIRADLAKAENEVATKIGQLKAGLEGIKTDLGVKFENETAQARCEIGSVQTGLADVRTEIASVRTEVATVRTEIATAKFDLTWRLPCGIAIVIGLLFAALRYLPPPG